MRSKLFFRTTIIITGIEMWTMSKFDSLEGISSPIIEKSLPRYVSIIKKDIPSKFRIAKRIVFDFNSNMSERKMWEEHESLVKKLRQTQIMIDEGKMDIKELEVPRFSLLDLKTMLAESVMKSCDLCENRCEVDRMSDGRGKCGIGNNCIISSESIHDKEEAHIRPTHVIAFMGCGMDCQFCKTWKTSKLYKPGKSSHPTLLAKAIKKGKSEGARNVHWTGGEPSINITHILNTLKHIDINTPQILNSNFYMTEKALKLLDGIIDVYLSDFRFGNNECAKHIAMVDNYFDVCTRNHKIVSSQNEMTIRHLILPNHVECCTMPILEWISENMENAIVDIMDDYEPNYKASGYTDLKNRVSEEEMKKAVYYAKKLKLNYVS